MSNIDMNKNSENGSSNYTGDDKFVIKNLNLHYGDFHALKNINMNEKIINKISFKEKDGYLIITLPKVEDSFSFIANLLVWISHNN